jgi:hypothetical protein
MQFEFSRQFPKYISMDWSTFQSTCLPFCTLFCGHQLKRQIHSPFSLLRDLLNTKEIHDAIGSPILVLLLQTFMGSAQGLNLRNLVWHGFPRPGEISPALASSLIILTFSIGEALLSQGMDQIEERPSVDLLGNL